MPKFEKSPPELVARFDAVAGRHPAAQGRRMFGYACLFVGGNLATGLFEDGWFVRLPDDGVAEALALAGATGFSPRPGRALKGWVLLPGDVVADDAALGAWIERAVAHAASMPSKG